MDVIYEVRDDPHFAVRHAAAPTGEDFTKGGSNQFEKRIEWIAERPAVLHTAI
jgi:hypothetical protein